MKWMIRIAVFLVVVIAGLLWFVFSQLGTLVKYAIETGAPPALKVPVKVGSVSISYSGTGTIEGLEIGNPEGYNGPYAIRVGKAELALDTSSVKSDKAVIRHIHLLNPEVNLIAGTGGTNLGQIAKNAQAVAAQATGAPAAPASAPASPAPANSTGSGDTTRLQVDEILISGAKLNASAGLLPGASANATLPDIKITGLGAGPEGITSAELAAQVLTRITEEAVKAGAGGSLKDLLKGGDIKVDTKGLKEGIQGLGKLLKP